MAQTNFPHPRLYGHRPWLLIAVSCLLTPLSVFGQSLSPSLRLDSQFKAHNLSGESLIVVRNSTRSNLFITAASDGLLKLWRAPGVLVQQFSEPTLAMLFNARMSSDDRSFLTAAYNGLASSWTLGRSDASHHYGPSLSGVTDVEILPANNGVVTSSDDGSIRFWSANGQLSQRVERPGVTRHLAQASQRGLIASTQDIGTVTLLSRSGQLLQVFPTLQGRLNDVVFSPDERQLLTGGFDGTIKIWNLVSDTSPPELRLTIKAVPGAGWVEGLAMNRDGLLASASDDGVLRLWSPVGRMLASIKLSDEHLFSVSFDPSGRRLLAAAQDGTVSVLTVDYP